MNDFEEWQRKTDEKFWRVFPWVVGIGVACFAFVLVAIAWATRR
jgi:hypothetical protein